MHAEKKKTYHRMVETRDGGDVEVEFEVEEEVGREGEVEVDVGSRAGWVRQGQGRVKAAPVAQVTESR